MLTLFGLPLTLLLLSLIPVNYLNVVSVVPTLTKEECDLILNKTHAHVQEQGWAPFRQRFYPSTEVSSHLLPKVHTTLFNKVFPKMLQPLIERRFWGPSRATGFFVVKYTPETQAAVPKHIDMGHVSWITQLNDPAEFLGGGTKFSAHDQVLRLEQGQSVVFPSKMLHESAPVLEGARVIIAGFADVKAEWPFGLLYLWGAYGSKFVQDAGTAPPGTYFDSEGELLAQFMAFAVGLIALLVAVHFRLEPAPGAPVSVLVPKKAAAKKAAKKAD